MKKFIKKSTAIISILTLIIFSLVIYGNETLPDSINSVNTKIVLSGIYSAGFERNSAFPVSNMPFQTNTVNSSTVKLFGAIPVKSINIEKTDRSYVALGGELIGIRLRTRGVLVVGIESFEGDNGMVSPARASGLKEGDILLSVDNVEIKSNMTLSKVIEESDGKALEMIVLRDKEELSLTLKPEKSKLTGLYKGGIWIRDSTGGIGTMTYIDVSNGTIATLGHGIYDVDTGSLMETESGTIGDARLSGVTKGENGNAGELRGSIASTEYGNVMLNCENGIYGTLNHYNKDINLLPVATNDEIHTGKAQIVSTVTSEGKKYYDIEIEKIDLTAENKNMIIKVTDNELLNVTGGIVQGMSGSPIIQDGRLVGAVTHVFLNDPTKGYGIFIENMLETAQSVAEKQQLKEAS